MGNVQLNNYCSGYFEKGFPSVNFQCLRSKTALILSVMRNIHVCKSFSSFK